MQAMLLAAGFGTRLRPYTLIRPKPLFPVLNKPLLNILLDMLRTAGCRTIIVNGHHLSRSVEVAVSKMDDVLFQQEPEILGTGGSLRLALSRFSCDPVLVMNGDIYHSVNIAKLYQYHIDSGNIITMALHDYPRFNSVTVSNDRIVSFGTGREGAVDRKLAFTGIHIVNSEVIQQIPVGCFYHIIDLYERLAAQGEKLGYMRVDDSFWRDIGTPEDYLQLHKEIITGEGLAAKTAMGIAADGESWIVDDGAHLSDDVVLSGWGAIGKAGIGRRVRLKNCVVWDGVVVADGACLENMIIAE